MRLILSTTSQPERLISAPIPMDRLQLPAILVINVCVLFPHECVSSLLSGRKHLYQESANKDLSSALPLLETWIDLRMISAMRAVLAVAALLVIYVDPSEPDRFVVPTYLALTGFGIYSIVIWLLAIRHRRILPVKILHWLDVAWYLPLIALSSGTNSIFFFFLFFAILVASFGWGFSAGLRVTIVSAALFTVVGYATAPAGPEFQLNRLLLRPIQLLVLGCMISFL